MERRPRSRRLATVLPALVVALGGVAAGCAHNPAPRGWLPTARGAAERSAWGGWLELTLRRGAEPAPPPPLAGEFLSVGPDSFVRILTEAGVSAVSVNRIERARLTGYDVEQTVGVWTFPGFLLTASNGWVLALTAPVWLLTGTLTTWSSWGKAKTKVPRRSWNDMRLYARYPAGWPADLDPALVRPDARWPNIARLRETRALIDKKETP
jgi:hypothetical protein